MKYDTEYMNNQLGILLQSSLGLIHPDIIYIGIIPEAKNIILKFVILKETYGCRRALEDIVNDFDMYNDYAELFKVVVEYAANESFVAPKFPARVFYLRFSESLLSEGDQSPIRESFYGELD